ncbi:hypothetical protein CYLTODRAFT_425331 [Cylindrobasidium torrendii FP15055 ss-10]|uniref:Uncharacterized protein n=1 Tax=Cylindrobasidium torrendii FP15055 ss-10 TaxID=1314674 RepID=A0A0D7B122_9AGAR|nr:hypothetical protein CYLTODRAFT_425331 [Cylindrobasidium torrendii FP15055 ss-10]
MSVLRRAPRLRLYHSTTTKYSPLDDSGTPRPTATVRATWRKQLTRLLKDEAHKYPETIKECVLNPHLNIPPSEGVAPARLPLMSIAHRFIRQRKPLQAFQALHTLARLGLITPSMLRTYSLAIDNLLSRASVVDQGSRPINYNERLSTDVSDKWLRKAMKLYIDAGQPSGFARTAIVTKLLQCREFYMATTVFAHGILRDPPHTMPPNAQHPLQDLLGLLLSVLGHETRIADRHVRKQCAQSLCTLGVLLQMRVYPVGLDLSPLLDALFKARRATYDVEAPTVIVQDTREMDFETRVRQSVKVFADIILRSLAKSTPKTQLTLPALQTLVARSCDAWDEGRTEKLWNVLVRRFVRNTKDPAVVDGMGAIAGVRMLIRTMPGLQRFDRIIAKNKALLDDPGNRGMDSVEEAFNAIFAY